MKSRALLGAATLAAVLASPVLAQDSNSATPGSTGGPQTGSSTTAPATISRGSSLPSGVVSSGTGSAVSSGTGLAVTPSMSGAAVAVTPSSALPHPNAHLLPGGTMVQANSTTTMGGPSGPGVSGTRTVVTHYWVNVPANVEGRSDFRRWMNLR